MTQISQTETKKSNPPTHTIYVESYINNQPLKVKVGVAWQHSKGNGFNISLNKMVAFENKPKNT